MHMNNNAVFFVLKLFVLNQADIYAFLRMFET
jgi:hypothetical protein